MDIKKIGKKGKVQLANGRITNITTIIQKRAKRLPMEVYQDGSLVNHTTNLTDIYLHFHKYGTRVVIKKMNEYIIGVAKRHRKAVRKQKIRKWRKKYLRF